MRKSETAALEKLETMTYCCSFWYFVCFQFVIFLRFFFLLFVPLFISFYYFGFVILSVSTMCTSVRTFSYCFVFFIRSVRFDINCFDLCLLTEAIDEYLMMNQTPYEYNAKCYKHVCQTSDLVVVFLCICYY